MTALSFCLLAAYVWLEKVYICLTAKGGLRVRFLGISWKPKGGKSPRKKQPDARTAAALIRRAEPEALTLRLSLPDAASAAVLHGSLSALAAALAQRWPHARLDIACRCAGPALRAEGIFSLTLGQIIRAILTEKAFPAKRRSATWTSTPSRPS